MIVAPTCASEPTVLALDLVEHGERCGGRDGVAAVGATQAAGVHGVHDLGAAVTALIGSPPPIDFAVVTRSGTTPSSSIAYQRPARPIADLDLVGDEHDPVRGAELGDPRDEAGGGDDEAALALDRLHDHGGDVLFADVLVHRVERVGQCFAGHGLRIGTLGLPAVRIGERQAVDLGGERPHALLVGHHLGGERHRQQRASVERVVEGHDRRCAPCACARSSPRSRPPRHPSWRTSSSSRGHRASTRSAARRVRCRARSP